MPAVAAVAVPAVPFTGQQIDQFDADHGDAGRAIGKMLALFFLYTVVVMSGVGYWTFKTRPTSKRPSPLAAEKTEATHEAEAHRVVASSGWHSYAVKPFAVFWVPRPRRGVGVLRMSNGFARPRKAVAWCRTDGCVLFSLKKWLTA